MASAGRILIMPKGDWKEETEYEMLDLVYHNGTSWLAKRNVVGIEPSIDNHDDWFKFVDITLTDYLPLAGGKLLGSLSFSDGRGLLYGTDAFAFFEAKKEGEGYRHIKIATPGKDGDANDWIVLANGDANSHNNYRVYGEHNKELLKPYIEQIVAEYLSKNN